MPKYRESERNNFPPSIQQLIQWIKSEKEMTPTKIQKLVKKANLKVEDLMPWADFDHSMLDSYGRQLIYDAGFFEMLVMSWVPGDFSTIHDHGFTEWGVVQVFGNTEHATFLVRDGRISTVKRWFLKPGEIIPVTQSLVHQMGNSSADRFLSFHVYGNFSRKDRVTGDSQLFELNSGQIQLTDNGVFFVLPENAVNGLKPGPTPDYLTWLRYQVELLRRLNHIVASSSGNTKFSQMKKDVCLQLFEPSRWRQFESDLMDTVDPLTGKIVNSRYWDILFIELRNAAQVQAEERTSINGDRRIHDSFDTYAELYDEVIGKPSLNAFMAKYLEFMSTKYHIDYSEATLLSIGCGTGLVEDHIITNLGMPKENLLGIDFSEAMVKVSSRRINSQHADIVQLKMPNLWDLTYCGLNTLQYISQANFKKAIENTAQLTKPGGYFFGDFITPDHIRKYPNVIRSDNGQVISLRRPKLIEQNNNMFQASEIINVSRLTGKLRITHEGTHKRYLPSMIGVRSLFKEAFQGSVDLYDAVSLEEIGENKETCMSTRYLVVAKKKKY